MEEKKRIILYVIYEKYGILDDWYENLFQEFKKYGTYLLCVVNGEINNHAKKLLEKYFDYIIYRENKGYDVSAYKAGIKYLYQEKLIKDELLICNNSFFAPLYPFNDMFNIMDNDTCDFWGITGSGGSKNIPYHIQSYFYVFKKNVVNSKDFYEFFINLGEIKNYQEAVDKVELSLTNYLQSKGFKAAAYMDKVITTRYNDDQLSLIKNGCPVLKRRKLIYSKKYGFNHGINNIGLLHFIENNTDFNIKYIYKNLLREFPFDQIDYCLNNNIIIDEENNEINNLSNIKYYISYNEKSSILIEKLKNKYDFISNIEYIKTNTFIDVLQKISSDKNYEFYAHAGLVWRDFLPDEINFILAEHLFLSIIGEKGVQNNTINHFRKNYTGMLIPFEFFHGIKFNYNKKQSKDTAYEIMKDNNMNIPLSKEIDILSIYSSFIINTEIKELIDNLDYKKLGEGYTSYINGGKLLRYISQYKLLAALKTGTNEIISRTLNNYIYKYKNTTLEDIIKSWWLSNKIKL